jgi:hypothetical protein
MRKLTEYQKELLRELRNVYCKIEAEIDRESNDDDSTNFADVLYEISPDLEFTYTAIGIRKKIEELEKREITDALINFKKSAYQLLIAYDKADEGIDDKLINRYPFQKSFDELMNDIEEWVENSITELKTKKEEF